MPYKIIPASQNRFSVVNKNTGRVLAYHTTKAKAQAQVRLLHGIEAGTIKN